MKKLFLSIFVIIALFLAACAQQQMPAEQLAPADGKEPNKQPVGQIAPLKPAEQKSNIDPEVQALFDKAREKTTSLHYTYQGPETDDFVYEFFIKGDRMRLVLANPYKDINLDKDAYNSIYMDTAAKTADGYCDAQKCIAKGRKRSISYNDYNIKTPFDWMAEITDAKKTGEQQIENRKSWKLETNLGTVYVDSYTGILQRIQTNETEYQFIRIEANGVSDEELRPME